MDASSLCQYASVSTCLVHCHLQGTAQIRLAAGIEIADRLIGTPRERRRDGERIRRVMVEQEIAHVS